MDVTAKQMTDDMKSREDLLNENQVLCHRIAELEAREAFSVTSKNKTATDALTELEEKFRVLVENAHEGIHVAQDGIHRFVNPAMARIYGQSQDKLLSRPFAEFIHPDDREFVLDRSLRRARGDDLPGRYAHRVVTEDGNTKWVEIDSAAISWEGRPAVLVFTTDITERKRMEEAIKEQDERYQRLVEESFDGILVTKETKIIFVNSRRCQMLDYSKEEIIGLDFWQIAHSDHQHLVEQRALARMRGESVSSQYEVKLRRKDGKVFDAEVISRAIEVQGTSGIQVWLKDVTKRKRAEEKLRESEEKYRSLVENIPDVTWSADSDGNTSFISPHVEKIWGYAPEEIYQGGSRLFLERLHPDDLQHVKSAAVALFEKGERIDIEFRIRRKDGRWIWVHDRAVATSNDKRGPSFADGVFTDITDRKKAEEDRERLIEQLKQALAEIKKLSGFLPICASCKKIRDDKGYWQQIEQYISDHSEALFSHSLCPDCARKLYPNLFTDDSTPLTS
jgi:PAS domain S-box-containing protein